MAENSLRDSGKALSEGVVTGKFVERRHLPPVMLALPRAFPLLAVPAALPPEMHAGRYLVQAERLIQAGEHAEAGKANFGRWTGPNGRCR